MSGKEKKYSNDQITVVWKPDLCIHSSRCWKELGEVFKPRSRPWIDLEGAETDKIIAQIDRCPSGALTYLLHNEKQETPMSDTGNKIKVELMADGPMIVHGSCEIKGHDGSVEEKGPQTAFCRCGASKNKPFCDGSHRKVGFQG